MKNLSLVLSLFLAAMFAFSNVMADPEIEFESEVVDYGTIENGSDGKREFHFKNTGDEPLIITKCNGSCGCTVPKCPKEPVMPGEEAIINVKYDTKRTGSFTKTVTVSSNAESGTKVLKIKGTVKAPQPSN